MSKDNGHTDSAAQNGDEQPGDSDMNAADYNEMLLLDQLETLEEDMVELGVTTLDEVRQRIAALHTKLDG